MKTRLADFSHPPVKDCVLGLLRGSYDLHIHTAPSHVARRVDDMDALRQADEYGMAGIMLKNHYESTAGRAAVINGRNLFATRAFGGVALNWPAGGINPYAAESCLRLGGRMVWMPTRDAAHSLEFGDMPGDFFDRPGICLFDEGKRLRKDVREVLEVVKQYDACVATGHISAEESIALCRLARSMNVKTILTHPNWQRTLIPLKVQKELADLGVYIEKVFANIKEGTVTADQMAHEMRVLGFHRVFMVTDRGQAGEELPVLEYAAFIETMLRCGLKDTEIRQMTASVPEYLVS